MNCKSSGEYIMMYFDGIINDIELAALKRHLKKCSECRTEFKSMDDTMKSLKDFDKIDLPDDFEVNVMTRISMLGV